MDNVKENKSKTPDYTKRAINNYIAKKDRITILCEKGTAERIRATGKSVNSFVNDLITKELNRIENNKTDAGTEKNSACDPAGIFINYPDEK